MAPNKYDVIIVGTGFASSFFLKALLKKAGPSLKILVLERGNLNTHAWQLENYVNSDVDSLTTFKNITPKKTWDFILGFGGGSNGWTGCAPRFLPSDFRLKSLYRVGRDWPISYEDLESYYYEVEAAMELSGPSDEILFPRNQPYPQPPHTFQNSDKELNKVYPQLYINQPSARPRVATANRPPCCAVGYCHNCPNDAKFTILNEMMDLYKDQRVTLMLGAEVKTVETSSSTATGVSYKKDGQTSTVNGDLIVLGANAIFNPFILLKSNLNHPLLGRYLSEQLSKEVAVDLYGLEALNGSTSITANGYMLYDSEHRAERAGALIESFNTPLPSHWRLERGKWRQRAVFVVQFEDLPSERSYVGISNETPDIPEVYFDGPSAYLKRAVEALDQDLQKVLSPLPIESVDIKPGLGTTMHIIGTTVMGDNPQNSVVDKNLIHHTVRNLVVLGSSVFPTVSPSNPTLTLSALSLWAADHVL